MNAIVCYDLNRGIGYNGNLLAKYSDDMLRFRATTMSGVCIMGRKTWESLPPTKLPGRHCYVLSSKLNSQPRHHMTVFRNLKELIASCTGNEFVIGGGKIYSLLLPYINTVYVSMIMDTYDNVDTYFPEYYNKRLWYVDSITRSTKHDKVIEFSVHHREDPMNQVPHSLLYEMFDNLMNNITEEFELDLTTSVMSLAIEANFHPPVSLTDPGAVDYFSKIIVTSHNAWIVIAKYALEKYKMELFPYGFITAMYAMASTDMSKDAAKFYTSAIKRACTMIDENHYDWSKYEARSVHVENIVRDQLKVGNVGLLEEFMDLFKKLGAYKGDVSKYDTQQDKDIHMRMTEIFVALNTPIEESPKE